ncbi:MAG: DUF1461 domain-containing protein [Chloroflexota bacterium]|nr:DUF1461 domain-containing protein [Chloroflexota bacterium]
MSTAGASATPISRPAADVRVQALSFGFVALASALAVLAGALILLLQPFYVHPALDASGSARLLGVTREEAHRLSDQTVRELLVGPGTFALRLPDDASLYGPSEAAHLRDVRGVLLAFLALGALSLAGLLAAFAREGHRPWPWRAASLGGGALAATLAAVGVVALVSFDAGFELFHRVFFPGGNWAFDPTSQRLVQLYPLAFWQLTSGALSVAAMTGGAIVWWVAGRRARRLER